MRFGCVSDALSAFLFRWAIRRGIRWGTRWGIRLALAPNYAGRERGLGEGGGGPNRNLLGNPFCLGNPFGPGLCKAPGLERAWRGKGRGRGQSGPQNALFQTQFKRVPTQPKRIPNASKTQSPTQPKNGSQNAIYRNYSISRVSRRQIFISLGL